jgi:hypothetical protein
MMFPLSRAELLDPPPLALRRGAHARRVCDGSSEDFPDVTNIPSGGLWRLEVDIPRLARATPVIRGASRSCAACTKWGVDCRGGRDRSAQWRLSTGEGWRGGDVETP